MRHSLLAGLATLTVACEGTPKKDHTPSREPARVQEHFERKVQNTLLTKDKKEVAQELSARIDHIQQRFGIKIELTPDYTSVLQRKREEYAPTDPVYPLLTEAAVRKHLVPLSSTAALKALDYVQENLNLYPPFMLKRIGPKRISLVTGTMFFAGPKEEMVIFQRAMSIHNGAFLQLDFDANGDVMDDNARHELFHSFDQRAKGGWTRDKQRWLQTSTLRTDTKTPNRTACLNEMVKAESYKDALRQGEGCRAFFRKELHGYIGTYGNIWKEDIQNPTVHVEDKAVYGDSLTFSGQEKDLDIHWLMERAAEDKQVYTKVQLMTGCAIAFQNKNGKVQGRFTRLLTEKEYNTLLQKNNMSVASSGFDYFRLWSTDDKGITHMDPAYYNNLLEGKKPTEATWNNLF